MSKIYNRSIFRIIQSILIVLTFGGLVFAGLSWISNKFFVIPILLNIGASFAVAFAFYIWMYAGENIHFELFDDGTFKYFKKKTLQNTFRLSDYLITWYRKTESGFLGDHDIQLKLLDKQTFFPIFIQAGPLRNSKFNNMFEEMQKYTTAISWDDSENYTKRC